MGMGNQTIGQAPRNITSTVYEASHVISAVPCVIYGISGYNSKGSAQFIQLLDAVSLPADTSVPKDIMTSAASGNFSIDYGFYGKRCSLGAVVANSSTGPTLTIGSADTWFSVRYKLL